ncbi:MAG: MFS transporter [Thermodesulfobacteriota bacterium]|nr:MFS transporter [Thermodesulfobacteriota bacterium]
MMTVADKKVFATLFFSIFSAVMGVGIVVPLLPIYAENLGASGIYIGLVFASFSLSRTFLLPLFGSLSDKTGRKPYIFTGLLGYTIVSIAFVYSKTVPQLIIIRFIQGIASAMIMPVAHAYIGDITPANKEGLTMGIFNMSMFISLSIGPLAGGIINDSLGMNAAFIGMGLLSFIGFLMSFVFLPPTQSEKIVRQSNEAKTATKTLITDPVLLGLFTLRFAYVFCIGVIWCFLPVMSNDFGLSGSAIGVLVMLGVFVSGILQIPMGMVADRIDKRKMAVLGSLIVVGAIVSYHWSVGFWSLFVSSVGFGLGGGLCMPPMMAMAVIKGADSGAMGSVMSFLTVAHSMGMLFGALSAGVVMDMMNLQQAFPVAGLMMLLGAAVFIISTQKQKNDFKP